MITKDEWITEVREKAADLRSLIHDYHPVYRSGVSSPEDIEITAPGAERACETVRQVIKDRADDDPLTRFDWALKNSDVGTLYQLLDAAWFGVPESTSCWKIPGFSAAVDLMDDLPE